MRDESLDRYHDEAGGTDVTDDTQPGGVQVTLAPGAHGWTLVGGDFEDQAVVLRIASADERKRRWRVTVALHIDRDGELLADVSNIEEVTQ